MGYYKGDVHDTVTINIRKAIFATADENVRQLRLNFTNDEGKVIWIIFENLQTHILMRTNDTDFTVGQRPTLLEKIQISEPFITAFEKAVECVLKVMADTRYVKVQRHTERVGGKTIIEIGDSINPAKLDPQQNSLSGI